MLSKRDVLRNQMSALVERQDRRGRNFMRFFQCFTRSSTATTEPQNSRTETAGSCDASRLAAASVGTPACVSAVFLHSITDPCECI